MTEIESSLQEKRSFNPSDNFSSNAKVKSLKEYFEICEESEKNYEKFWSDKAETFLEWEAPYTIVLNEEKAPFYQWFEDGKLNASYNCLDKNIKLGYGKKIAINFESDDGLITKVTFNELLEKVCLLANAIKKLGFKKGDRSIIYMPMSIEGVDDRP